MELLEQIRRERRFGWARFEEWRGNSGDPGGAQTSEFPPACDQTPAAAGQTTNFSEAEAGCSFLSNRSRSSSFDPHWVRVPSS